MKEENIKFVERLLRKINEIILSSPDGITALEKVKDYLKTLLN